MAYIAENDGLAQPNEARDNILQGRPNKSFKKTRMN